MSPKFMVCLLVSELEIPNVESIKKSCCECTSEVWVSNYSLSMAHEQEAKIICIRCVTARKDFKQAVFAPPTHGQIAEIAKAKLQ